MLNTYSDLHALSCDQLHTAHDVLLHLDQLRQLAGEVRAEGTGGIFTECMACNDRILVDVSDERFPIACFASRLLFERLRCPGCRPCQAASGFSGTPSYEQPIVDKRWSHEDPNFYGMPLTNATLSEPPVRLGGGHWGWGVLNLRGGRDARLAHRIGAMHCGGGKTR